MPSHRMSDREAFDRSFEFFANQLDEEGIAAWGDNNMLNITTDSDPFEFSAISSLPGTRDHDGMSALFPEDPFFPTSKATSAINSATNTATTTILSTIQTVRVGIHEQISALYADSVEASVHVEGSIHVKPLRKQQPPFCLICRDLLDHIERLDERTDVCHNITNMVQSSSLHATGLRPSDRVLRVTLPDELADSSATEGMPIANYTCVPALRPVPLLVKSRVGLSGELIRVGFKIRSNPSNGFPLNQIMIILAVPPNVDGQSVRMSRKGGMWDEMKRTVAWSVEKLDPGNALEIQLQFLPLDGGALSARDQKGKFPLLIRCNYVKLFSSIEVLGNFDDGVYPPVKVMPSSASRLLHRKV